MVFKEFSSEEWEQIEKYNIFNGFQYARKQYAYKKRAQTIETHSYQDWIDMCAFFNFLCCKCESSVIGGMPTKDHIYPISLGGSDSIRNVQPLCRQCNTSKYQMPCDYRESYCFSHGLVMPEKWRYNG